MNNTPYILWLGGIFSEETMLSQRAISPAGNRWQIEFIKSLQNCGIKVVVLGQLYEQRWPLGSLRPGRNLETPLGLDVSYARYWNMPIQRHKFLYFGFKNKLKEIIQEHGYKPSLVVPYNPYYHHATLSRYIKNEFDVDWVPIVADFEDAGKEWCDYKAATKGAKGQVFLSYWAYENCPCTPKLHIDGGISPKIQTNVHSVTESLEKPYVYMYTGAVTHDKGIDLLLDAFAKIPDDTQKFQLWICGKMALREEGLRITNRINNDQRVKYFGVVKEVYLQELSKKADSFVNPRLPGLTEHIMNFPSKLLEYLSYGKPIISTVTPGLAPQYKDFLICPEGDGVVEFSEAMMKCSDLSPAEKYGLTNMISNYISSYKSWDYQASKFINWLNENYIFRN